MAVSQSLNVCPGAKSKSGKAEEEEEEEDEEELMLSLVAN